VSVIGVKGHERVVYMFSCVYFISAALKNSTTSTKIKALLDIMLSLCFTK